jgi:peptide/nickel transport system substrate-binding protein
VSGRAGGALVLCAALLAGACAEDRAAARPAAGERVPGSERYGGTLVIGGGADVTDVSPLTWKLQTALYMQQFLLFLPLLAYDERLQPVPRLARSWEVNADTTALTFHLRDDVHWHDGRRTSAHDLQFSYERARDPGTGYIYSGMFAPYGRAEVVDSFTWRVGLEPHAEFLDVWRVFAPVPRHVLEGVAPEDLARHPFATRSPVGNGPFRFVERVAGQRWVFEANPDFPAELGGRPYLDRVVYRVIPEPTTLLTELLTGGIDVYTRAPVEQAERIARDPGVRLVHYPDRAWTHVVWNHRRAPFGDARVRRALTLAVDRQAVVETARAGYGSVANSTVAPVFPQHDPAAGADLGFDPDRARALLAEAGLRDRDGDGVLEDPAGRPFRFTLEVPQGYPERRDAGEMVQADLRRIGVDARLRTTEFNSLLARLSDARRRDFDAVVLSWAPEYRIDDSELFACRKRDAPVAFTGYCDPATDALLDSIARTVDRARAQGLWSRYQHRIARDQPVTFLFFSEQLHGIGRRVQGAAPDARGYWVGIERWWIDPAPGPG